MSTPALTPEILKRIRDTFELSTTIAKGQHAYIPAQTAPADYLRPAGDYLMKEVERLLREVERLKDENERLQGRDEIADGFEALLEEKEKLDQENEHLHLLLSSAQEFVEQCGQSDVVASNLAYDIRKTIGRGR